MTVNTRTVKGLLGKKLGMTQGWDAENKIVPITVVEAGENVITQIKNLENDGYAAIQLAYGAIDPRKVDKPSTGHFAKAGVDGVGAGSFTCGCTRAAPGEDDDSAFTATAFGPGEVAGPGDFAKVAKLGGFANAEGDGEVAGLGAIAKKARSDSSGLTGVVGLDLTAVLAEASAGSAATLFAEAMAGSAGERFGMMESHNRGTGETELGLVPNSSTSIRAKH